MLNLISSCGFSFPKNENKTNEDSVLFPIKVGDGYLFAVADGVGSYKGADKASKIIIDYIRDLSESDLKYTNQISAKLKLIISELNNIIEYAQAATTLTFGYLNNKGLKIGHIGDCRLYTKDHKKLKQLTKDHSRHQKLLDEKIFTAKELKDVAGKNVLTTAISKNIEMTFDEYFIPLSELSTENNKLSLFIMSDGAHSFWEKRPRFSLPTMSSVAKFTNSLLRRIEKNEPIDDYSLIAVEFEIKN